MYHQAQYIIIVLLPSREPRDMLSDYIDEVDSCKHPFELTNRTFVSPSL
jgi:hypothetical protein